MEVLDKNQKFRFIKVYWIEYTLAYKLIQLFSIITLILLLKLWVYNFSKIKIIM